MGEDLRRRQTEKITSRGFPLEIRNRFQQLSGEETDISKNWTRVKEIYNETAGKSLDLRSRKHKD